MNICTSTTLIVAVFALVGTGTHALDCYGCIAWAALGGSSDEACRNEVPGTVFRVTCTPENTMLIDGATMRILNKTTEGLAASSRAIGDPLCLKTGGTDTANRPVVLRSCGVALVNDNLNGYCETDPNPIDLSPIGTIRAGSKTWACTSNMCNTGSVTGTCNSVITTTPGTTITSTTKKQSSATKVGAAGVAILLIATVAKIL